jgi:hypothetical protein
MRAYSLDLRERVMADLDAGGVAGRDGAEVPGVDALAL